MRLKTNRIWPFIKKLISGNTSPLNMPSQTASSSAQLYRNISETPLFVFVGCITHKNLLLLVISGKPTEQELQDAWDRLQDQYTSSVGDNEHKLYLTAYKDLIDLEAQYNESVILIHALKHFFFQPFLDDLNKLLNSDTKLDYKNDVKYYDQLKVLERKSKGLKLRADMKRATYNKIASQFNEKGKKSEAPTREYFDGMLITLSDHAGYRLTDQITVFEYCERIRRLNKEKEKLEKHGRGKTLS